MAFAAEVVRREDGKIGMNPEKQVRLTGMMMEQVLQGLPSSLHLLIEGASVYLCFNEERLQAVLDEKIDGEDFRSLISIPFVIWRQDGWMLHDAVRAWVLEDVLLRKPNHYERMRRKALDQIRLEETLNPERRESLQFDKMSLHENPLVGQICFSGHLEDVTLEECRESDLHEMLSLYSRFH